MSKTLGLWHFYIRQDTVYVPTVARTDAGFFLDTEPIAVVSASDLHLVEDALGEAVARGNPTMRAPDRDTISRPKVLQYAGVTSWSMFESTASCWEINRQEQCYTLQRMRRRADRGWEDDPSTIESFPPDISLDDLAKRVTLRVLETKKAK